MQRSETDTVLLTSFEPFAGQSINASARAVAAVEPDRLNGVNLVTAELPCVFGRAMDVLHNELRRHSPTLVVCVGQAGGLRGFALERIAINLDDACIKDNDGAQPIDAAIAPNGPAAYWSTLPVKAILRALRANQLPAELSHSAGTFVCNHVFYGLMRALARQKDARGGFIHVPFLPEQAVGKHAHDPALSLAEQVRGLELVITTALSTREDLRIVGGAIH